MTVSPLRAGPPASCCVRCSPEMEVLDSGLIDNYLSGIRSLGPQGKGWVMLKDHLVPETHPLLPGHFHTHLRGTGRAWPGPIVHMQRPSPSDSTKVSQPRVRGWGRRRAQGPRAHSRAPAACPPLATHPLRRCLLMLAQRADFGPLTPPSREGREAFLWPEGLFFTPA